MQINWLIYITGVFWEWGITSSLENQTHLPDIHHVAEYIHTGEVGTVPSHLCGSEESQNYAVLLRLHKNSSKIWKTSSRESIATLHIYKLWLHDRLVELERDSLVVVPDIPVPHKAQICSLNATQVSCRCECQWRVGWLASVVDYVTTFQWDLLFWRQFKCRWLYHDVHVQV